MAEFNQKKTEEFAESLSKELGSALTTLLQSETSVNIASTDKIDAGGNAPEYLQGPVCAVGFSTSRLADTRGIIAALSDDVNKISGIMGFETGSAGEEPGDEAVDAFCELVGQAVSVTGSFIRKTYGDIGVESGELTKGNPAEDSSLLLAGAEEMVCIYFGVEVNEKPGFGLAFVCTPELLDAVFSRADGERISNEEKQELTEPERKKERLELNRILKVKIPVRVVVAQRRMTMEQILEFSSGSIIETTKSSDEYLDLSVNNKIIGKGEVVIIAERFGLQVKSILSPEETIKSLGSSI